MLIDFNPNNPKNPFIIYNNSNDNDNFNPSTMNEYEYNSGNSDGDTNIYPFFIIKYDTFNKIDKVIKI